ncbi:DNA-directed DNA polymerase alpha catalytic subunit POL1 [Aspergillus brunneoviolaceus CBS 621.78]|uniref:DNA polymerase alpha, catalytic subunit n=1 Tax=Aspergillus brunneoviolaceus CBS 621.78 TaxID=1450534 RepID=A0ACD1FUD2_9EURO|nr:DNA polymerase alpha, catalytic subunit [Aspergillus brunneoviolaceus CBS 621.78]RAH40530.1 DNA polymerase alpha, catalytic subunit [Aspergillus brunneoviolaceus CBS 621.78]
MSARAKLAELRALRAAGKKRLSTYEVEEQGDVYEEVDDEGYKKIIRNRLDQDDFVVDDNGEGYADDGREVWNERGADYDSESEDDELPARSKAAKRKREEEKQRKEKINNGISKYFNSGAAPSAPKPKPVATAEDDAFMADLLGEVDTNIVPQRLPTRNIVKSETRRKVRILSPPLSDRTRKDAHIKKDENSDPVSPVKDQSDTNMDDDYDDGPLPNIDDEDFPMSDPMPSSPISKAIERKTTAVAVKVEESDEDDTDLMEVTQATGQNEAKAASINMAGSRPVPKLKKESYPSIASSSPVKALPDVDASWNDVRSKLNVLSSPAHSEMRTFGKLRPQDVVEEDGSLRMFWLDFTEVNGSLCLFGKVKNKQTGSYASAFVKVDNILRKLYFLPRENRHKHGRETDEEVDMEDVYREVDDMMSRLRVGMHKIKPCTRKYAFEVSGIPKETDYLKLLYPYDKPALPMDVKGETFSHVFGTNTALFEQFVLWKSIMGPCWLKIEEADFSAVNNASWCKFECQVSKPALISPVPDSENLDAPPLTLMSLSFRTQLNVKENKQEILVASARVYENVSLTDTTPPEKLPCKTFTVMRPVGTSYPMHFEAETRKQRGTFMLERSEQFLLSKFLALFEKMDPDVLMGHQLQEVDLSVLLNRLKEKKTPGWHRLGRLKRGDWPKNFNRGGGFFAERHLIAGRLMCDVANDMGKSLMMKCQSWSLTEMCELYLGQGNTRQELDTEAALKSWATTKDGLMNFVNHCDADTYFIAALVLKLQMLPLTKVLTNIAGNSWARTLSGTRAERNEYILLHEFHRNKYICPDKYSSKLLKAEEKLQEGDEDDSADKKKKDKYKGGLVFEPEKGLYDRFVLVMDFNSLYPSIIQEFNICFTTVERTATAENDKEEKVPEVPSSEQEQGILPRLIATLVGRRREVKKLMKDKRATPEQLALWDTKQLAFKLTANSMYGCLGYTQSRFYARPLAMLTTFKGREILRSTKELAESKQLRVIYGDTDSVMINTNMDTISDAIKVGEEFKKSVNERYRLLEIDIDNIFRRLLLHAKKKYAAVNITEVDGKYVDKLEVKGLDMKRREYCSLSKEVSQKLLNEVLSGEDQELVLNRIHDYLRDLAGKMREFTVPVQKYVIYTKLSKRPEEYPNKETMPPVQVALRELARGKTVRPNDVISYIVTSGDSETASLPPAKRSYTLQDVMKPDSELKPDIEFYLLKQIFPPIERLCAPIPGTDAVRLAECLGLDVRKYQINTSTASNQQNADIFPLESQIPDSVRFESAARLTLTCRSCKEKSVFEGLLGSVHMCTANGVICPNQACQKPFSVLTIVAQLETQIRAQTSKYYEGWLVCDDTACGNRTRQISVYGHRCLGPKGHAEGCLGRMSYEYTEKQMYNQLLYFAGLWDVDKARTAAEKDGNAEKKDSVAALVEFNRQLDPNLGYSTVIMSVKKVLVIAGSDSSGGAGLEADQRVLAAHGVYALTATTGLTAQNTLGVQDIFIIPPEFVKKQINAGLEDVGADVVKLGMLSSAETINVIAEALVTHQIPAVVLDPVMVSTSGSQLLPGAAVQVLRSKLLPLTTILTPNIPEALLLLKDSGIDVSEPTDLPGMVQLAKQICSLGSKGVLLKGGHLPLTKDHKTAQNQEDACIVVDVLYDGEEVTLFETDFLISKNTHGTGCSLASAIAANLALGKGMKRAVQSAVRFVEAGIKTSFDIGKGSGPINHFHSLYSLPFAPGRFIEYALDRPDVQEAWKKFTEHEFVRQLGDGTLPLERFKSYLVQDYLYLIQFARSNALAAYKAGSMESIAASAQIVLHIQRETALHLDYCASFGLTKEEMEKTPETIACTAYSRYILDVGQSGDWLALQMALAPCLIGYGAIAQRLYTDKDSVREGNRYWKWVENYVADDYTEAVRLGSELLEKHMREVSPSRMEELIKIFVRATELEIRFWDMGLGGGESC